MKYKKIITLYSNDEIPQIDIPAKYHAQINIVEKEKPTELIITHHNGGPKIIIFQRLEYKIGGIETWGYNLAKMFQDRDITFVFQDADKEQVERLSTYANIIMDDGETEYKCDIFISANYDGNSEILHRVHAKKYYQTIHSDFGAMSKCKGWENFKLKIDPRYQIVAVSEQAQKGLKKFGYDSIIATNPLAPASNRRPFILLSMTRMSIEKGAKRILKLAQKLREEKIDFIWILASTIDNSDDKKTVEQIRAMPEFKIIEPSTKNDWLYYVADYCVQLSDTEAYCYTIREALQRCCPVIATDFPVARELIEEGMNGYIVDMDLKNLDVRKIFGYGQIKRVFMPEYYESVDPNWEKILGGSDVKE